MTTRKKILFFGELAPGVVHGISLSNQLNLELLEKYADVHTVEQKTRLAEHRKRTGSKVMRSFSDIRRLYRINRQERCHFFYTVFSLSTFGGLSTLASLLAFRTSGAGQVVLHLHRGDFEQFYRASLLNRVITRWILRLTDTLIVLSENQKHHMQTYARRSDIAVLENSLNSELAFTARHPGDSKFLFISNYIEEKGIYDVLDVFRQTDEISLQCFGSFVNNQASIEAYARDNIRIGGFIDGFAKYAQIRSADALILPSWNEGQPTIILEAMMAGTIVLTTRVGLIEEMLGPDYPFYFEARDQAGLMDCIERFRQYPEKEVLSAALRQRYENNFSKTIHERKLVTLFGFQAP